MPESRLARELSEHHGKGYVIAPAGFGKTHLIAMAVKAGTQRQLVLTHTYAGVNALKSKMKSLDVPQSRYHVDTIASWALRICLAYPHNSGWNIDRPDGQEWSRLYESCTALLTKDFIQRIVCASYDGVYVDEYQDCSISQHNLVSALAEILPCRILGDPMQAIFDFAEQPVNWTQHVYPQFDCVGKLTTPWRWRNANASELGEWLGEIRRILQDGEQINLRQPFPKQVTRSHIALDDHTNPKRLNVFYSCLDCEDTVIAIHKGDGIHKNKTHELARQLSGKFSSIEEVEGAALFSFIKKTSSARTPSKKLKLAIEFAAKCMTCVNGVLSAGTKRGEVAKIQKSTKYPNVTLAANSYFAMPSSANLRHLLLQMFYLNETQPIRRDLLNRALQVLLIHSQSLNLTLEEAARKYQLEFRYKGRPLKHTKLIGTTLLVKGLEFDHAIILDATSLSTKELYVALTRGARQLTIISSSDRLPV